MIVTCINADIWMILEVSKGAKIRNRYNQVHGQE